MKKMSSVVPFLTSRLPGLFNKKSIEALVLADKISFESAAEAMSVIDSASISSESASAGSNGEVTKSDTSVMQGKNDIEAQYKGIKFDAMLQAVKQDDTLLYTEYVNIENALKRIKSEIVAKEENNLNQLLNEIKTTTGDSNSMIDDLIQTTCSVDDSREDIHGSAKA